MDEAPAGPLFVAGAGPGWYLLGERANPTRFDVLLQGIGTDEAAVAESFARLRAQPPAVVLVERMEYAPKPYAPEKLWAALGISYALVAPSHDEKWTLFVADSLPAGVRESPGHLQRAP